MWRFRFVSLSMTTTLLLMLLFTIDAPSTDGKESYKNKNSKLTIATAGRCSSLSSRAKTLYLGIVRDERMILLSTNLRGIGRNFRAPLPQYPPVYRRSSSRSKSGSRRSSRSGSRSNTPLDGERMKLGAGIEDQQVHFIERALNNILEKQKALLRECDQVFDIETLNEVQKEDQSSDTRTPFPFAIGENLSEGLTILYKDVIAEWVCLSKQKVQFDDAKQRNSSRGEEYIILRDAIETSLETIFHKKMEMLSEFGEVYNVKIQDSVRSFEAADRSLHQSQILRLDV
eukprot:Lankesteria_metandrocarpae@DN6539_c0_g1_i1.p1